jgi:hypothetical protein
VDVRDSGIIKFCPTSLCNFQFFLPLPCIYFIMYDCCRLEWPFTFKKRLNAPSMSKSRLHSRRSGLYVQNVEIVISQIWQNSKCFPQRGSNLCMVEHLEGKKPKNIPNINITAILDSRLSLSKMISSNSTLTLWCDRKLALLSFCCCVCFISLVVGAVFGWIFLFVGSRGRAVWWCCILLSFCFPFLSSNKSHGNSLAVPWKDKKALKQSLKKWKLTKRSGWYWT